MKNFKLKTNRAGSKRFRISAKGRIKRKKAFLRHGMRKRTQNVKRVLRQKTCVNSVDAPSVRALLPNS